MNKNSKFSLFIVAAVAVAALALSPSLHQSAAPLDDGMMPLADSEEAVARYRELRATLNEGQANRLANLTAEGGMAVPAKDQQGGDTATVATDGRYIARFRRTDDISSDEGTLSAIFVQGTGNCQLSIHSARDNTPLSGRSVGCAGTVSVESGKFELAGSIITNLGDSRPFNIIGVARDGRLTGSLSFDGQLIELNSSYAH